MTLVRIIRSAHTPTIRLSVNGEEFKVPAEGTHDVPERFIGALRDSNVEFETVAEVTQGEEGAGGIQAAASPVFSGPGVLDAEFIAPEDFPITEPGESGTLTGAQSGKDGAADEKNDDNTDDALLDHSVPEIAAQLEGMDTAHLERLLKAEKGGKTRSTLMAAIEEELAKRA